VANLIIKPASSTTQYCIHTEK